MNTDRLTRLTGRNGVNCREKNLKEPPQETILGTWQNAELPPDENEPAAGAAMDLEPPQLQEMEQLRGENGDLSHSLAEMRLLLQEARKQEESWKQREQEYEGLLDEKSEVIRELHRRLQEAGEGPSHAATNEPLPREEELLALHEELENERRQLQEDEEALMRQMRDMEMQMSRERAELARQRNELQRLHTEIQHELELGARDATLRERLAPLQRRAQDALNRKGATLSPERAAPAREEAEAQAARPKPDSGFLRRLFGK